MENKQTPLELYKIIYDTSAAKYFKADKGSYLTEQVDEAVNKVKDQMIGFYKWMQKNDTAENAEQYYHYTDRDMLNEYLKTK